MNALGLFFLMIFSITLIGSYIAIRRRLLSLWAAGLICAAVSFTSLFAYGMTEDLHILHSLAVGIFVGLGFTGLTLVMAAFFLANQPSELEDYLRDRKPSAK
jgi:hypothetical protein